MSDHFGIGQAIKGIALVYFQSARRTGRTTSLVASLKNGDRVIFVSAIEAERVKRLCAERGVEIETAVVPSRSPERIFDRRMPVGRTVLDHSWVEAFYIDAIDQCREGLDRLEKEASNPDPEPPDPRRPRRKREL